MDMMISRPRRPGLRLNVPSGASATYAANVLALNPLIYYPMDETTGSTMVNYGSVASANGTYTSVTLAQQAGAGATMGLKPYFDGTLSRGVLSSGAFWTTEVTVSIWLYPTDSGGNHFAFGTTPVATGNGGLDIFTTTNKTLVAYEIYGNSFVFPGGDAIGAGWTHVAVSLSKIDSQAKTYVNKVLTHTSAYALTGSAAVTAINVGQWGSGNARFQGYLSDVAIFGSVLTQASINILGTAV